MANKSIIALKSTYETGDIILKQRVYATANKPIETNIKYFVLLGESGVLKTSVIAFGKISGPFDITDNTRNLFGSEKSQKWNYEYELKDIIDLQKHILSVDDVFLKEDADCIRYVMQFGYADDLLPEFVTLIQSLSSKYSMLTKTLANNIIQNNKTSSKLSNYDCPYEVGMNVLHNCYGMGEITKIEKTTNEKLHSYDAKITIEFSNNGGTKIFSAVQTKKYLKPVE